MYDIAKALVQPYLVLLLLQGLVLARMLRRGASGRRAVATLGVLWFAMLFFSIPFVGRLVMGTLEWSYPPLEKPSRVDAILVMGGGVAPPDAYRAKPQVTSSSYARCMHAAGLYQAFHCPLILCGGATEVGTDATEAKVMADALVVLGVDRRDLILEESSLSTRENAQQVVPAIRQRGFQNVLLVTHARHMRRTDLCFRKLGLAAIPSPCSAVSARLWGPADETWVPGLEGLGATTWAIREWVALAYYWCRGWI